MNIKQKLFSAGAFALLLGFTACNDDDDKNSGQLSKQDAKSEISAFNNSAKADLQDLADAEGLTAVQDFFALVNEDDPFGRIGTEKGKIRAFLREKGREFRSVFTPAGVTKGRTAEGAFDFEGSKGVYEWNDAEGVFVLTDESDIISILFPTEGSTENNAELQITAYSETEVVDEETQEVYYEPTLLKAAVFTGVTKVASLDFEAEYDETGFPVVAEISLMVSPYTASLSVDVSAATTSSVSISLKEGQEVLLASSVTVKYADESKNEASLASLEGFVQFKNLKMQGKVNMTSTSTDLNDYVSLALYANNKKAGDIVFETVNNQQIAFVKFADGTKEKLEDVLKPVVDEINALTDGLQTNG